MTRPPAFDPLTFVPDNYNATNDQLVQIMNIYYTENRDPTDQEIEDIFGPPVTIPSTIAPPPDGWAGKNWGNPDWGRKLRAKAAAEEDGIYNP